MNTLDPKDPNTPTEYAIDVRRTVYAPMLRDWPYPQGAVVRAKIHTGFYYECTQAGETSAYEPRLPRADGEKVRDGSLEWTARHPANAALPSIQLVDWIVEPAGELTVTNTRVEGGIVYPTFSGGEAGSSYQVTARVTWSTGQVEDVTVVIPVANL